jgi:hypothetical protein
MNLSDSAIANDGLTHIVGDALSAEGGVTELVLALTPPRRLRVAALSAKSKSKVTAAGGKSRHAEANASCSAAMTCATSRRSFSQGAVQTRPNSRGSSAHTRRSQWKTRERCQNETGRDFVRSSLPSIHLTADLIAFSVESA